MAIIFHPKPGQILLCDFSTGFKEPEMVKSKRPVVVLTGTIQGRFNLVTIVPLSTVEPMSPQPYHHKIPKQLMPMIGKFQESDSWVKGDMIYTVGFHRLDLIRLGKCGSNKKREYFKNRLDKDQMKKIYFCILHGLNLGYLGLHL